MASRNPVTITGNLTADPEARSLPSGRHLVSLQVAENIVWRDQDGKIVEDAPVFWPVAVWDEALGANVLASLHKGDRVTVIGRYRNNTWEAEDGTKRSRLELAADEVAANLRFAQATVTRNPRRTAAAHSADDPWATSAA